MAYKMSIGLMLY
jgi:hypothetical protein